MTINPATAWYMQKRRKQRLAAMVAVPNPDDSLQRHFDASDASSLTFDSNNRVAQWRDQTGGAHALQANDLRKPVYDAVNRRLLFNGARYMEFAATGLPTGNLAGSIVLIGSLTQHDNWSWGVSYGDAAAGKARSVGISAQGQVAAASFAAGDAIGGFAFPADNKPHVAVGIWMDGKVGIYLDNSQSRVISYAFNTGSGSGRIGDQVNAGSEDWDGHIHEIIIYNKGLTADDLTALQDYASRKWGIA